MKIDRGHTRHLAQPNPIVVWPRTATLLGTLGLLYLSFGKGFSYAGVPPIFIGEIALVLLSFAEINRATEIPESLGAGLTYIAVGLGLGQVAFDLLARNANPIETLRGFAVIYYSAYALVVFAALRRAEYSSTRVCVFGSLDRWLSKYTTHVLSIVLLLAALLVVNVSWVPRWPHSNIPLLYTKATDLSVTLAFYMPFVFSDAERRTVLPKRWTHATIDRLLWVAAFLLVFSRSRGALIGIVGASFLTFKWDVARMFKKALLLVTLFAVLMITRFRFAVGGRELSARAITTSITSLIASNPQTDGNYADTREWRARWWRGIWHDILDKVHVFHGFGWGDNLAIRYGVVTGDVSADPQVLRLPHNIFLSVAGRAGLLMAGLLVTIFLTSALIGRHLQNAAAHSPAVAAARSGLLAALLVGMTDVFIESPQGGIVCWMCCGLLWWAHSTPAESSRKPTRSFVPRP
jgi:O-Antigen ligase